LENNLSWQEILGFLGGFFTTVGIIPQLWRLFKLKSAREISLPFTLLFLAGGLCWFSYGMLFGLLPLIVWNTIAVALMCIMLYAKLKFGK
jgi:MtN3 and saliva related transmembrane protein